MPNRYEGLIVRGERKGRSDQLIMRLTCRSCRIRHRFRSANQTSKRLEIDEYHSPDHIPLSGIPKLALVGGRNGRRHRWLGETFFAAEAVEAYIHANLAPIVLGMSAVDIEAVPYRTRPYIGFVAASTELRARSALDIALWDVLGKLTGQPISVLLGGRIRSQIPVYNTCAGNQYVRGTKLGTTQNFGIASSGTDQNYEDLDRFLNDPVGLAGKSSRHGIDSMKIWPFDFAAESTQGQFISPAELDKALAPFKAIKKEYGDRMQISAELHGMWNLSESLIICQALDEIGCDGLRIRCF
ncbi:MAG: hypothetical protein CM1200mP18_02940 [Gammaproteobacteria bacterium]|nr:MAG: hypothetical protein CM1200mP18_02940 [Gammaproteobacteria bacterium]